MIILADLIVSIMCVDHLIIDPVAVEAVHMLQISRLVPYITVRPYLVVVNLAVVRPYLAVVRPYLAVVRPCLVVVLGFLAVTVFPRLALPKHSDYLYTLPGWPFNSPGYPCQTSLLLIITI